MSIQMDSTSQLRLVFMYYCSYGDRYNLTNLKSAKFQKILIDSSIIPNLISAKSADIMYMKQSKNTQHMTFHSFQEILIAIAEKSFKDGSSQEKLSFLFRHINMLYTKVSAQTDYGELLHLIQQPLDSVLRQLYTQLEPQLTKIHHYIFSDQSQNKVKVQLQYSKFLLHYGLQPDYVNQIQAFLMFEIMTQLFPPKMNYILPPKVFIESLFKIAKLNASKSKNQDLLDSFKAVLLSIENSEGYAKYQQYTNQTQSESKQMTPFVDRIQQQYRPKSAPPIKQEIHKDTQKLREIFEFYCQIGEPLNVQYLKSFKFIRLLSEAAVINYSYSITEANLVYAKATKNAGKMNFPQFLQACDILGQERTNQICNPNNNVLKQKVMRDNFIQESMSLMFQDPRYYEVSTSIKPQIETFFRIYQVKDRIDLQHFLKFCLDFSIAEIISQPQIMKAFQQLVDNQTHKYLDKHQFVDLICLLSMLCFTNEVDPMRRIVIMMERINESEGFTKSIIQSGSTRYPKGYSMEMIEYLNQKYRTGYPSPQKKEEKPDVNELFRNLKF